MDSSGHYTNHFDHHFDFGAFNASTSSQLGLANGGGAAITDATPGTSTTSGGGSPSQESGYDATALSSATNGDQFLWPQGLNYNDAASFLFANGAQARVQPPQPGSMTGNAAMTQYHQQHQPSQQDHPPPIQQHQHHLQAQVHFQQPHASHQQQLQPQHLHLGAPHLPPGPPSAPSSSHWNSASPSSSNASAVHTPLAASVSSDHRPAKQARMLPPKLPVPYPTSSPPVELVQPPTPPESNSAVPSSSSANRQRRAVRFASTPDDRPKLRRTPSDPLLASHKARGDQRHKLDALFGFIDQRAWSVEDLFVALSDMSIDGPDGASPEHTRKMAAFLEKRPRVGKHSDEIEGPEEIYQRWKVAREGAVLGRKIIGLAIDDLYQSMAGEQHGSIIRDILTKDSVPYDEAQADIKMLDAALSRAPSPRTLARSREISAPIPPTTYVGRIVIPPIQADILGGWLMSPGRPGLANERDSITPEHMRIYSSLSPLELHARGAELCRVILTRDRYSKAQFSHYADELESFLQGPVIAPSKRCGFHEYDDYSLWHHALMTYLQICTRYPSFRDSKPATIDIVPDQSVLPPTLLEATLIERALHVHWEAFRQYLLAEGGLLRRAVRAFSGVKTRPMELMLICDDASVVMKALKKSLKEPGERILPYDPRISEARNEWRQSAYWSEGSHLMMWSAATSHFLEISALYPRFSEGVRELPGLDGLLKGVASGSGLGTGGNM